jgi:hypothetical protein
MADLNPARAIQLVARIEQLCSFATHPAIETAVEQGVPFPMPKTIGAFGLDVPLWAGLGTVGMWAALDAFAERADLSGTKCSTCGRFCIPQRFAGHLRGSESQALAELEDLRHLYAHNYAGETDDEYWARKRHVLVRGKPIQLAGGGSFDGQRVLLGLPQLKSYAEVARAILERFKN